MKDVTARLAKRIKELREAAHLTQAELAKLTRKSIETTSNFERGKTVPSVQTLASLADKLGVGVAAFFDEKPPRRARDPLAGAIRNKSEALDRRDQEFLLGVIDLIQKRSGKT